MATHSVVIAGSGPTGLMLGAELALAGVDVAIVERRQDRALLGRRAGGLHSRTLEILDQRGIAERFLALGKAMQIVGFNMVPLSIGDLPTRFNYGLALPQAPTERLLAEWAAELGVTFYRGREVTGFAQDASGVNVSASDGLALRAQYLVGCDGGRSLVRKAAGIEFPGWDATTSWLMAEASFREEPKWGFHKDATGSHAIAKIEETGQAGFVLVEREVGHSAEPTLRDVSEALIGIYGTDFGIHNPTLLSRFTDMTRQAAAYRRERVLLAGDAAHVHPPMGGQGLNLGVQDAVNLGWKLAQVVKGISPESLLDTYHVERHPVGARVLRTTMAQSALRRTDEHSKALSECVNAIVGMDGPRRKLAGELSGLDIHYELGAGHLLLGRRMPDLELLGPEGPLRIYRLLHKAQPLLLDLGGLEGFEMGPWASRVQRVRAQYTEAWELPVIGAVEAPSAVLVRPDGYVAWVGDGTELGLSDALGTWFGMQRSF